MVEKCLLSIVIPTKNRYQYLKILLESLLKSKTNEFEIIIQDNSDNSSDFEKYINKINDARLKYNHTGGWLSVIDNCDLGVGRASGKYVCMLGDDDGILINQSLELIKYLSIQDIHAAVVNKVSYDWPDTSHAVWGDAYSGKITFKPFDFKLRRMSSQKELGRIVQQGGAFGLGELARVYHGFVSKELLNQLYSKTGTFFPGPSPDMANAVGLSKYIVNYVYADFPTVISGHCKKSTGGQGGMKEHHGAIAKQTHLPKDTVEKWSPRIPFFWSGATIYAESARRALKATGREEVHLNYNALYACCLVYEKHYRSEIMKVLKIAGRRNIINYLKVFLNAVRIFFKRGINFAKNLLKKRTISDSSLTAKDIGQVMEVLNEKFEFFEANRIK